MFRTLFFCDSDSCCTTSSSSSNKEKSYAVFLSIKAITTPHIPTFEYYNRMRTPIRYYTYIILQIRNFSKRFFSRIGRNVYTFFMQHNEIVTNMYITPKQNQNSFLQTLSRALLARLFSSSSASPGSIGLLVTSSALGLFPHTQTGKSFGQVQPIHH